MRKERRPPVGTVVKTKNAMGYHDELIYEGPVTSHDVCPDIFRQQIDKINGKPKKPGTYLNPVVRCVWEVIE